MSQIKLEIIRSKNVVITVQIAEKYWHLQCTYYFKEVEW